LRFAAVICIAAGLASSGCALRTPIMVLPPGLADRADVLEVSGLRAFHVWNHDIRFGPYRTTGTRVGLRSDDTTRWGVLDDHEIWRAKRPLSFTLEGEACPRWTASCLGEARRSRHEAAIGITTNGDGLAIDRRVVENTSEASFACSLESGSAPGWRLRLSAGDASGFGGTLVDAWGTAIAHVRAIDRQTGEPYTYAVPSPLGFLIETPSGPVAAVERAFAGKVLLDRHAPDDERCAFATVAAALLLWEPLR
jgi:hypothetical protein